MQELLFWVSWAAIAWFAGKPLARAAYREEGSDRVWIFFVWWATLTVLSGIPAFVCAMLWPVTLIGLVVGALYRFVPQVRAFVDSTVKKARDYADE
ncbi:hypothetical protein [Stenotrophomonas phage BUCTxx99]|nr:hypothetical protein [Stenotrophomonas phage BUCTxx99]